MAFITIGNPGRGIAFRDDLIERMKAVGVWSTKDSVQLEDVLDMLLTMVEERGGATIEASADTPREPTDAELDARATRAHSLTALSADDQTDDDSTDNNIAARVERAHARLRGG